MAVVTAASVALLVHFTWRFQNFVVADWLWATLLAVRMRMRARAAPNKSTGSTEPMLC